MESTCLKDKCQFWIEKNGEVLCPFFINTLWKEDENSVPKTLNDCAPKRNTIMLMDYSSRAIGIQKDYEEQRNMYANVLRGTIEIIEEMKQRNRMLSEKLGLEYRDVSILEHKDKGSNKG
jgi:hypothetical protein